MTLHGESLQPLLILTEIPGACMKTYTNDEKNNKAKNGFALRTGQSLAGFDRPKALGELVYGKQY